MAGNAEGVPEPRVPPHTGTCGLEDAWVAEAVSSGKGFHHPVDLLGFSGQPETPQELPGGGAGPWAARLVGTLRGTLDKMLCFYTLGFFSLEMGESAPAI